MQINFTIDKILDAYIPKEIPQNKIYTNWQDRYDGLDYAAQTKLKKERPKQYSRMLECVKEENMLVKDYKANSLRISYDNAQALVDLKESRENVPNGLKQALESKIREFERVIDKNNNVVRAESVGLKL